MHRVLGEEKPAHLNLNLGRRVQSATCVVRSLAILRLRELLQRDFPARLDFSRQPDNGTAALAQQANLLKALRAPVTILCLLKVSEAPLLVRAATTPGDPSLNRGSLAIRRRSDSRGCITLPTGRVLDLVMMATLFTTFHSGHDYRMLGISSLLSLFIGLCGEIKQAGVRVATRVDLLSTAHHLILERRLRPQLARTRKLILLISASTSLDHRTCRGPCPVLLGDPSGSDLGTHELHPLANLLDSTRAALACPQQIITVPYLLRADRRLDQ